jgi:tungstate transport system substrate-binding protein
MLRRTFLQTTASAVASPALAQESPYITLASARSAARSGLLAHIVPLFRAETGINVHVVAVGTRQALAIGARGEADVLLLHDRAVEDRFVAEGHGLDRRSVMSDDFVLVGPQNDPAGIRGQRNAVEALKRIAAARPPFASRGDASGTHRNGAAALDSG